MARGGFLPDDITEVIELYLAGAITTEHLTTTADRLRKPTKHSPTSPRDGY